MKQFFAIAVGAIVCWVFIFSFSIGAAQQREIAITFDDLPSVPTYDVGEMKALTTKLLKILKQNKVPAVGFVNEGKLHQRGETRFEPNEIEARTAILNLWVDAGFELGNHTYSHLDMFKASAEKFKQDLIAGEQTTQKLLAAKGMKLRYFRHPFLNTGASPEMKSAFDKILAERNYIIAPVTVDNQDYVFAAVYADALKNNDRTLMNRVAEAYAPYMEAMLEFYEKQSSTLLRYEIKQILLVHANMLNADHFDKLITRMKKRGYQFISLEEALRDNAYKLEDHFVARAGISWLQRWAFTQKHQPTIEQFKLEPDVPEFIKKAYNTRKQS
jgi:peptidoglycan-N-acetylglucosamine deacetylase